ncbi:hypothetical protein [Citrobacter freundii]|uniref:Uncharacterized protein n=1 Tax=Citrobacter freundii TaxID=546 RepID=A0A7G2IWR7_CITFR|nr:hypothetical protein [Citrobacter freundii]
MKFSRKASVGSAAIRAVILTLKRSALRVKKINRCAPGGEAVMLKNCRPAERRSAAY